MHLSKPLKNMNRKIILSIVILVLSIGFYWFQVRPAQARKDCIEKYPQAFGPVIHTSLIGSFAIYDKNGYETCLREHGLNE